MSEQDWKPIPFETSRESDENMTKHKKQEPQILSPITRSGSTINSAFSYGQDNSIVDTGDSNANGVLGKRHTSVSFNIPPTNLSQSYHRHSISSKLNLPRSFQETVGTTQGATTDQHGMLPNDENPVKIEGKANHKETGDNIDKGKIQDAEELPDEDKDCALHMPGDFIYIKPDDDDNDNDEEKEVTTSVLEENNKPKLSNKIIFNKDEYCPTNDIEIDTEKDDSKFHILIGATGSVAAIKIPLIIDRLFKIYSRDTISIQLILTKPAEHFLNGLKIPRDVHIWREDDMKSRWWDFNNTFVSQMDNNKKNSNNNNNSNKADLEPLLFHELSRWADIFLIAPLSANSLAKLANGICNNLITSVVRDWNVKKTPIIVAPAMNTFMYINPMTKKHLLMLKEDFPTLEILKPVEKMLICGDIGMGGMREWSDITENIRLKIKEIHRKRHENEGDNEDQEIEEIDKDLAEDNEEEDEDEDEDEEDTKNTGEDDDDEDDDEDDDDDDDDDDE
ncbi:coenzyme A biosynthesis protein 3 [Monosporozyma servazzii]